jgi:DNA-binding response OmpR family regulator
MWVCPTCGQSSPAGPLVHPRFDPLTHRVTSTCGMAVIDLETRESEILQVLVEAKGRPVPTERIFIRVWGHESDVPPCNVAIQICKLRRRLRRLHNAPFRIASNRHLRQATYWVEAL